MINTKPSHIWVACLFFGLWLSTGCIGSNPINDTITVLMEKTSPNGEFIATVFSCSGGGAAGYEYLNVNLRRAGDALDPRATLLGKHKTWKGFTDISFSWIDNGNLNVSFRQDTSPEYREHVSTRVDSRYGITMHYTVID